MKILLTAINAKYIHSNPAIYSLRAYAGEEAAKHIELAEYTVNQRMEDILCDIYSRKPDMIGFSCYIWNWTLVRELLTELPKLLPKTDIWLGGPEVSFDADRIMMKHPWIKGIMIGEGEATFRDLAAYYLRQENGAECACGEEELKAEHKSRTGCAPDEEVPDAGTELRKIPGLYLKTGCTPGREPVDMSSIPFLYKDLAPFENRIIYYESSRGCPYRCSYCLSSLEKAVRKRDINVIKEELRFFLNHGVKQVKFVDRTFNCDHEHAMAVWQYIKENDNGVTNFHFEISADILRQEEIELLNSLRPGLVQLEIGVQSANSDALKAVRRNSDLDRLERAVAQIGQGRNVHRHLDLIAGLPFEDYESFGKSFDRVYRMRPEQLQLGFLKVLKGSEMWEKAEEYGICSLDTPPYEVLRTRWLSYEELRRLKGIEEMVELYYNSGQFTATLPVLEKAFESPFDMYEKLAGFYQENGYTVNSPARSSRYHILLAFAQKFDSGTLPRYKELLTYDLYLRENVKSRPEFAADLSPYKEKIREFYQREETERRFLPDYAGYDSRQLSKMTHLEAFFYPIGNFGAAGKECETFFETSARTLFYPAGEGVGEEEIPYGEKGGERRQTPYFILFDYRRRDPLTNGCGTHFVILS